MCSKFNLIPLPHIYKNVLCMSDTKLGSGDPEEGQTPVSQGLDPGQGASTRMAGAIVEEGMGL